MEINHLFFKIKRNPDRRAVGAPFMATAIIIITGPDAASTPSQPTSNSNWRVASA